MGKLSYFMTLLET
ncbi:Protein CBG27564 [Caenorhabditis briggsae]|uniref:Protein CBG27564 n=1 Tax=Caenorhabditis briggsae TaxID=6238 RepID=B6IKM7_CAEBR|nr:Protein CBG27564 [Caenorhabditis briggsae]CAS00457.1 Protein CBG27564 [Caenorhabditis briggsae]